MLYAPITAAAASTSARPHHQRHQVDPFCRTLAAIGLAPFTSTVNPSNINPASFMPPLIRHLPQRASVVMAQVYRAELAGPATHELQACIDAERVLVVANQRVAVAGDLRHGAGRRGDGKQHEQQEDARMLVG